MVATDPSTSYYGCMLSIYRVWCCVVWCGVMGNYDEGGYIGALTRAWITTYGLHPAIVLDFHSAETTVLP